MKRVIIFARGFPALPQALVVTAEMQHLCFIHVGMKSSEHSLFRRADAAQDLSISGVVMHGQSCECVTVCDAKM